MPPDTRLTLLDIYTELHTREPRDEKKSSDKNPAAEPAAPDAATELAERKEQRVPVLKALVEHPRLVLLGHAGSGKSTALRYLAHCLAENLRSPNSAGAKELRGKETIFPSELRDCIPVWVELKKLFPAPEPETKDATPADGSKNIADEHWLWKQILAPVRDVNNGFGAADAALLLQARNEGRCWFFLDGLDEITERHQAAFLLKQIAAFIESPLHPRVTITCRQYTWDRTMKIKGWNPQSIRLIDPLKDKERDTLAKRLYAAAGFLPSKITQAQADERRAALARVWTDPTLNHRGRLEEMAGVPLTLTMLAWLAGRNGQLPRTRAALYEQVIHALLWSLDDRKKLSGSLTNLLALKNVRPDDFVAVLAEFAYDKLKESPAASDPIIYLNELRNCIVRLIAGEDEPTDDQKIWAEKIICTIQLRAGVLREEGRDKKRRDSFRFMHRSFHEFFAALHLARNGNLDDLAFDWAKKLRGGADDGGETGITLAEREDHWEILRLAYGYLATPFAVKTQFALPDDLTLPSDELPFLFPEDLKKNHYRRSPVAAEKLLTQLAQLDGKPGAIWWHDIWLAGELIEELEPDAHPQLQTSEWKTLKKKICGQLVKLIEAGALTPPERAAAGSSLGRLGDPRPSVGLIKSGPHAGLPEFEWIRITEGEFLMGGPEDWQGGKEFSFGLIKTPYRISRYPVTVRQFQAFVDDRGYERDEFWDWSDAAMTFIETRRLECAERDEKPGPTNGAFQDWNHPRGLVTWFECVAFCVWASKKTVQEIRLPSEAEWERAARGPAGRGFPWGGPKIKEGVIDEEVEKHLAAHCNMHYAGIDTVSAVGLFPAGDTPREGDNKIGVADLSGNVSEWCGTIESRVIG